MSDTDAEIRALKHRVEELEDRIPAWYALLAAAVVYGLLMIALVSGRKECEAVGGVMAVNACVRVSATIHYDTASKSYKP